MMSSVTAFRAEPLLRTKLFAPTHHGAWVPRERLLERLNDGLRLGHKLILVSAPPGFGKTTLISEWLLQSPAIAAHSSWQSNVQDALPSSIRHPLSAWLALDEGDNDTARFMAYLYAALETLGGQKAEWHELRELLKISPLPGVETLLVAALNLLQSDTPPAPHVLVLEDYHVIHNTELHRALAYWLDHAPPALHLVITSRADPSLPLARLRARMQLTEVRAADLRFTPEEAASFLQDTMGLALTPAQIAALEERTEGWVAGLQLAALSLQKGQDADAMLRAFTGTHRYIMDYLVEEVLQREPESIQTFLLHTSLLERFNASLCDAVTPAEISAGAQIEYLERRNLFVIPLDDRREWYRYHHLFAEVLRQRLRRVHPERVTDLYLRASDWFHAHALRHEAIQTAITALAYERAAQWIEASADEMLQMGEHETLRRWLAALPARTLDAHPALWLKRAAAFVISHQLDAAEAAFQRAQSALENIAASAERSALASQCAAIGATVALNRNDVARTLSLGQQALDTLDAHHTLERASVLLHIGVAYDWDGQLGRAAECFTESRQLCEQSGDLPGALLAISNLGAAEKTRARYHRAAEIFREGMQVGAAQNANYQPGAIYLYTDLSEVLYEWNDLSGARPLIEQVLERSELLGLTRARVTGYRLDARWLAARGKTNKALAKIAQATQLAQAHKIPDHYASPARALQVILWLNTNQLPDAVGWAEQSGLEADTPLDKPRQEEYLALARVRLAQGAPQRARVLLERLIADATTRGRTENAIWGLAILALVYQAQNEMDAARATLARALMLAQAQNFVRTFLDLGEPMRALLTAFKRRSEKQPEYGSLQNYLGNLIAAFSPAPAAPKPTAAPPPTALPENVEALTDRELQVLHLVAQGLADKQIANQLVVATGTVKRHLNNIYGKLGVNSRTQALARARQVGWIE
ncbi:MAG: hypothetical protein HY741_07155 [Chloroflexi bacterium]|nr:hypothetical protein [Chloroflexota bacterium]